MSPVPKANEPGNNPQSSGEGGESLEPPPQGYESILNTGAMSSDDEGSDEGGAEDTQYGGYQLLVQDPEPLDESDEENEDTVQDLKDERGASNTQDMDLDPLSDLKIREQPSTSTHSGGDSPTQPNLPTHLAKLLPTASPVSDAATRVAHTDTKQSLEERKNTMATDDQIRAAMAGFSLPTGAIPPWARAVEEGEWKEQLVARIQSKDKQQHRTGTAQPKGGTDKR